ncbi:MAG: gliding motility-associated C-terminal domain-containing protein, partial [Bacteroidia bacterium]|nr:gliding motility-associated C-terminal domain-containing protein [Bacteroidia bacterium]
VFGSGLTLMPNISGGTLTPTFYTTSGNTYWYWSGTAWVNTGHSTGNGGAVNLGGCASRIYNLVGTTGQVYVYDGTSNGSLLTTIPNFTGNGPYDIVADCNCNFYVLNTSGTTQGLYMYDSSGNLQCTYTLSGMPSSTGGGGLAIIGNQIYVRNGGFYAGTIAGNGVTFSSISYSPNVGDFATCPVCNPTPDFSGSSISGGMLTCANPSINISVNAVISPVTPVTYSWTGPSVIGSATGTSAVAGAPGTYSCIITTAVCPPTQTVLTTVVTTNSSVVSASINPSGSKCVQANAIVKLKAIHGFTNEIINWSGPSFTALNTIDSVNVSNTGTYTLQVVNPANGCSASATMALVQTPTVNLTLSSSSLCLYPYNNSPASITITPQGASTYTLHTSSNFSTSAPNGSIMPCIASTITGNFATVATVTLIGSTAGCKDTANASISIVPNPVLSLTQATADVCPGESETFTVSGASMYLWSGSPGLSTTSGSVVTATPASNSFYNVKGTDNGCTSATSNITVTILPLPVVGISPPATTICAGSTTTLQAIGNATSFTWSPSGTNGNQTAVSPSNSQIYTLLGSLNSCTSAANAIVYVAAPPVVSISLSSPSVCAHNYNGSPNTITVTPAGATNYTFISGGNVTVGSPNGPLMTITPSGTIPPLPTVVSTTLIGQDGVCKVTTTQTFVIIPNPDIFISPTSASICPGGSASFSVSGTPVYNWLPASHYTLTSPQSIVADPLVTSYYSVFGTQAGCRSVLKNALVIIHPLPLVNITSTTHTLCGGTQIPLSVSGTGNVYYWYPSGSLSSATGSTVFASPTVTQIYTVVAALNTCTSQALVTVSAIPIPTVHAVANESVICSGGSTGITVTGANTFQWSPVNTLNPTVGNYVVASPNANTTYTIKGFNGICTGTGTIQIKTVDRPSMTLEGSSPEICKGGTVTIKASGAQLYTWQPASALSSSSFSDQVTANPSVTTNYTVYGTNSAGVTDCYQQLSFSVQVLPDIVPAVSNNATLCLGEKTTLYASGGNTYSWSPSQGLNTNLMSAVVANPTVTTEYTVNVSRNYQCGISTKVLVVVNPLPSVFAGRDTTYNLDEVIMLRAVGSGTLNWIYGDGIPCKACPETQVFPERSGCYVVEAINDFGCKASDDICLEITDEFGVYIPNSFTPNNDGLNDEFIIFGTGITNTSMQIFNRWGQLLFSSEDYTQGWNGLYKGQLCEGGTYTYVFKYTGLNRKKYIKKGGVTLIR